MNGGPSTERFRPDSILADVFSDCRKNSRAALIPFISAGDPSLSSSFDTMVAIANAGADIIELGLPFSDPVADGPIIQRASQRALAAGFTTAGYFDLLCRFRQVSQVPVIIFTYFNPILAVGITEFAQRARQAGANGVLTVDLSFDESHEFRQSLDSEGLSLISLVAPTTPEQRAARIAATSTGFLYCVSAIGVTGVQLHAFEPLKERVRQLREICELPIAVGFGVKTPDDVRHVAGFADGVVVGSELIKRMSATESSPAEIAKSFVASLRSACANTSNLNEPSQC